MGDLLAQLHLRICFEFAENHGRDLRRAELLGFAANFHFHSGVAVGGPDYFIGDAFDFFLHFVKLSPHEPLDRVDSIAGVGDGLPLGGLAHESVAGLGESDHGRRRAFAFGVL